jgi:hypothetical protein
MLRTVQRYRNLLINMFSFVLKFESENTGLACTWGVRNDAYIRICNVTCRVVRITKITGSSSDVWIY